MEVSTIANKKLTEFTLKDVIERKITFTETNTIYDKKDYEDYNAGNLAALDEMLGDIKESNEEEFVKKYLEIMKGISKQFEKEEFTDTREVEKLSGYNNAIVDIMKCINPYYEYDVED
ncbi:MAG: hypothetical protein WBF39_03645 [Planococcus donghaensis]